MSATVALEQQQHQPISTEVVVAMETETETAQTTPKTIEETPAVELRVQQSPEDVATTQRLSVVRARLHQFEVIANNVPDLDKDKHKDNHLKDNTINKPDDVEVEAAAKLENEQLQQVDVVTSPKQVPANDVEMEQDQLVVDKEVADKIVLEKNPVSAIVEKAVTNVEDTEIKENITEKLKQSMEANIKENVAEYVKENVEENLTENIVVKSKATEDEKVTLENNQSAMPMDLQEMDKEEVREAAMEGVEEGDTECVTEGVDEAVTESVKETVKEVLREELNGVKKELKTSLSEENKEDLQENSSEEHKESKTVDVIMLPPAIIVESIAKEQQNMAAAENTSIKDCSLTPSKSNLEEYPEDLNPFKSDDEDDADNDKENIMLTSTVASTPKAAAKKPSQSSLNPFDSSDDEVELEKSGLSATSTPSSKVPPPRPPPPRLSKNPFGDTDNEEEQQFSRRSSLSTSMTRKTPVPTPRTNLSQSQNPTPEPTPRLSNKSQSSNNSSAIVNASDYYGSANSLSTPSSLYRNSELRGSNHSLTSSAGGTIRSRKQRRAPLPPSLQQHHQQPPPPVKELFPSSETIASSSKTSTPSSSTVGTPRSGRKKRLAPAPPKPARLDPALVPAIHVNIAELQTVTQSKNLLSYPLQTELDSKLSDEEKALLEGNNNNTFKKQQQQLHNASINRSSLRLIPLDASLLHDAAVNSAQDDCKCDDLKHLEHEEHNVVYRRILVPPPLLNTPTQDTNPLLDHLQNSAMMSHDRQLEKLKDNKEANNRNRQSQISATSSLDDNDVSTATTPTGGVFNKSAHGKWKRRKGPAPALPIPPRKVLQMLPLQEIKHELDIIEVQQQGLERQGVVLEKMIRDRCEGENGEPLGAGGVAVDVIDGVQSRVVTENSKEVEDLILQLFELVNEKNELFRRQAELMYLRRQHRLEQEQADLEYEIRVLMAQPERNKTDTDKAREEALIARLVEVVQLRNEVIECLEMDRLREAEEDMSIKQRLELHTAQREDDESNSSKHATLTKLSKKEKKKQKESKKLGKSKKLDADKDADESELNIDDKQKAKKKKKKFLF